MNIDIENLNKRQKSGLVHPLTCCSGDKNTPNCLRRLSAENRSKGIGVQYTDENEGVLIATENGWICPCGEYTQAF